MVELTQTAARSSQYFMHYYFEDAEKAVMTYRFKAKAGSGTIWLPCLAYNGSAKSPLNLVLNNGSTLQYSGVRDYWQTAVTGLDSGWHTVREVVDLKNNVRELWIDGSYIALNAANMEKYPCDSTQTMNSVVVGFYSAATSGTIYLDDLSVTAFVDGQSVSFGKTEITLPKGASIELQPEFVPENTSVQGITYVSGDTSIATVDANGVVTAIANGQAVITATSALFPLNPIQITVTVSGEITGSITVDPATVSLPVDGHLDLNADLSFEGGVMADETVIYTSANPGIATVDEWGEVLAVAAGTTTIKVQSVANPAIQAEIPVVVTNTTVWKTIYVSVDGTGDGTSAETPTTLAGAIAQLAAIDKTAMEGNIEVVLADGYYYQSKTIKLSDAHGGTNRYSVIFRAETDGDTEQPVIGGGIQIEGSAFTETETKGVYVYDLTKLGFTVQTRQLFVDNVRATRARSEGTLKNPEYLYDEDGTNIGLICDNTELLGYGRIQDLEMVSFNQWAHTRGQVAEIRESSDGRVELIMDQPGWYNLTRVAEFMAMRADTIVYYENALELLDEAGEWYLDEGDQKLYYMPRVWEDMDQVEFTVPIMDGELITVEGTGSDQQVQNVRFDGITFADTTWLRPSTSASHPANQNNHLNDEKEFVDAAITVKKANSVDFLNCTFVRLGINAINMYEGVQNSLVSGCHFYDISGNAVAIGKCNYKTDVDNYNPTDVKKMMKNCDVINNYIHDIGVDYLSSSAVSVGFAADVDLCNNEIFDIPYCGFHIGYGWNTKFANITKNINISN
ncbi:MAG: Ig-like domain-containing protein, partial [Lachnospiraceae bacterium]|nr:Ig-like domain-containing protein [Lachnospiraceae bacterium]